MRLKITSDGTVMGTRVVTEKGEEITNVSRIEFSPLDAYDPKLVEAKLTLVHLPFELTCDGTLDGCVKLQSAEVEE